jgi:hypothetical protein
MFPIHDASPEEVEESKSSRVQEKEKLAATTSILQLFGFGASEESCPEGSE